MANLLNNGIFGRFARLVNHRFSVPLFMGFTISEKRKVKYFFCLIDFVAKKIKGDHPNKKIIMTSKKWFVPRSYGWGFEPTTWQGWLTVVIFIGLVFASLYLNNIFDKSKITIKDIASIFFDYVILITTLIYFCLSKTKGKVQWNWGKKK